MFSFRCLVAWVLEGPVSLFGGVWVYDDFNGSRRCGAVGMIVAPPGWMIGWGDGNLEGCRCVLEIPRSCLPSS